MKYAVDFLASLRQPRRIQQADLAKIQVTLQGCQILRFAGRKVVDSADRIPALYQSACECRANEAGNTSH